MAGVWSDGNMFQSNRTSVVRLHESLAQYKCCPDLSIAFCGVIEVLQSSLQISEDGRFSSAVNSSDGSLTQHVPEEEEADSSPGLTSKGGGDFRADLHIQKMFTSVSLQVHCYFAFLPVSDGLMR